ncbi:MAG: hypothetical protein ACRCZ1_00870 [Cetobacterium sp.]
MKRCIKDVREQITFIRMLMCGKKQNPHTRAAYERTVDVLQELVVEWESIIKEER